MGLLDGNTGGGMLGLLSPDDRLMAALSALSRAGAAMAQPGQSRGQALASGFGAMGPGMMQGMQHALMGNMMGLKFKEAQQLGEWKKTLADAFGGSAVPSAPMAAAPGQPVAQDMADRMNGQRAATLNDPKVQGAIMGLYGPTGLAALRAEDKAAETKETFDEQGRKVIRQWNPATKRYDISVGAAQIDPEKMQIRPDGTVGYLRGFDTAKAGVEGATTTAKQQAEMPFVGPRAALSAAGSLPYDIQKAWAIPRVLPPGAQVVAGGAPGSGAPAQVIMTSPNPSPGSQQGKYEQGVGELQSDTIKNWRSGAEGAFVIQQNVGRMREALDNGLKTGTFANGRQIVGTALRDMNVAPETVDAYFKLVDAKKFDSASKELVTGIIKTLGANPTNTDRDFIEAIGPRLKDSPEAVRSLLDWMDKKAQGKIDLYTQGYEHASKGGDPLKFEQDWWKKNGRPQKQSAGNGGWSVTPVP